MHRFVKLIIPAVLSISLLTGCKSIIPQKPDLDTAFSCGFELNAFPDDRDSEMNVTGTMERYGMGIWEMSVDSPESMKGLLIRYNEGNVTASLGELSFDVPAEKLPESAMFRQIFDSFDSCAAAHDPELYSDGENAVYNTPSGSSLAFEKTDMKPVMLTLPNDITVKYLHMRKHCTPPRKQQLTINNE